LSLPTPRHPNYNVPASQGAATILISASPSLTSPVVNASDSLNALSRQYVATTNRRNRLLLPHNGRRVSHTGRFQTVATLSSTGTLRLERGGGGTIQHGTTSALGSSGASPLTPDKGVYYYNAGGGVTATVVR